MERLINHGIIEVATLTPKEIEVGDPKFNTDKMLELVNQVTEENRKGKRHTRLVVFPELSITGYNCGELFNQSTLLDETMVELKRFVEESQDEYSPLMIIGAPIRKDNQLFNCAVAIFGGKVLGIVPKTYLPNYTVLYEARYFHPSTTRLNDEIEIFGETVPFTPNILFKDERCGALVSAELCEDLWMPLPPSSYHCLNGSNVVVNLSSSNQVFGKTTFRQELLRVHSTILACGYVYTCATDAETTTDSVFAGHNAIADNGWITGETKFFEDEVITYGEIDLDKIAVDRIRSNTYMSVPAKGDYVTVKYKTFEGGSTFKSEVKRSILPFVPFDVKDGYKDVLDLQVTGLAKRLSRNEVQSVSLKVNDSNNFLLALIACYRAFEINGYDIKGIKCIIDSKPNGASMTQLLETLGVTVVEDEVADFIIGQRDMTDFAIGEAGFEHSVYEVNSPIPKTAISSLIRYFAENDGNQVKPYLLDLLDPGLDYRDKLDEKLELSYLVYDFILYNMLKNGFGPRKIYDIFMANINDQTLGGLVLDMFKAFYIAFFSTDFNRNRPDTVKVYPATLTVNDWRMPSNASKNMWLRELDKIELVDSQAIGGENAS